MSVISRRVLQVEDQASRPALGARGALRACAWVAAVGAALGLGIFADIGERLPDPWGAIPQLGLPWVALAALWGFAAGGSIAGGCSGLAGIALGLGTYTLYKDAAYGSSSVDGFLHDDLRYWVLIALIVGPLCGVAGAWTRRTDLHREVAWGLLVAAALAEGGSLLVLLHEHPGDHPVRWVAVTDVALGAAVFAAAAGRRWRWLLCFTTCWLVPGFLGGLVVYGSQV